MAVSDYTGLITPEHRNKPKFITWLTAALNMLNDAQTILTNMNNYFDIDNAAGNQLDILGEYLNTSRTVAWQPTVNTDANPTFVWGPTVTGEGGWGEGYWKVPSASSTSVLNDDYYRTLLKATVAKSYWDGTITTLVDLLTYVLNGSDITFVIKDNQDMTFTVTFLGSFTAVLRDLIAHDLIVPRPMGVSLTVTLKTAVRIIFGGNASTINYGLVLYGGNASTTDYTRIYKYTEVIE